MVFEFEKDYTNESLEDITKEIIKNENYQQEKSFNKEINRLDKTIKNISEFELIKLNANAVTSFDMITVPKNNESFFKHISNLYNLNKYDEVVNVVSNNPNMLSVYRGDKLINILVQNVKSKVEKNMGKYQKNYFENQFNNYQLMQLNKKHEELVVTIDKEITKHIYENNNLYSKNIFFQNEKEIMLMYHNSKLQISGYNFAANKVFKN